MGVWARKFVATVVAFLALSRESNYHFVVAHGDFNYREALTKSLVFLEAQRSGKLPPNHRPAWRGDSGLDDGKLANVDLVGGYYDAGDNVKYGLPMAFTVTTLAWSALAYGQQLQSAGELENVRAAIRWGTDYLLKAASRKKRLYVQVGDPVKDHECWVRPENMCTSRTVLQINEHTPGTEIAAETAAALAASSIVFKSVDRPYARRLRNKAKLLFQFAKEHKGTYAGNALSTVPFPATKLDELMWAATWLYMATKRPIYMKHLKEESMIAAVTEFSQDLKYAGAQILISEIFHQDQDPFLASYKNHADSFICSVLPDSPYHQVFLSPGCLIHLRDGANSQYVTGTAFLFSIYGDVLAKYNQKVICGDKQFDSTHVLAFAKQQMDYLLGKNPRGSSYMVGFGNNPPQQAHHRGASVPLSAANQQVSCPMSFVYWYNNNVAILGGPDKQDNFVDKKSASVYTEPCTYINSLAVGALAMLLG